MREADAELVRHDLRDLGVEALPHLGAAVTHEHRTVGVDVHQRAGLVVVDHVERDAELERRQREPLLQHRARRVESTDLVTAPPVAGRSLELGDELVDHVVLDGHAVRRDVALGRAVEIRLAHVERIAAELARDVVDEVLDRDRALRAAEAAKRGVRLRVGLAGQRENVHVGQVVRVVEVADGARAYRARQVGREAGAGGHLDLRRTDHAVVAESDLVVVMEAVPLPRGHEIIVAVEPQLHRPAQPPGRHRRDAGEQCRLRLLAAEAAAHPPHLDHHLIRDQTERMRDDVLHLGRVLRRAVEVNAAVFLRHCVRDLPLEIEVLLTADVELRPRGGAGRRPSRRPARRVRGASAAARRTAGALASCGVRTGGSTS